jgi:hypothetical protein
MSNRPASKQRSGNRGLRNLLFGALAIPIGGCASCVLLHQGSYRNPEPLPETKILDIHCHTAGIGSGASGCFVSEAGYDLSLMSLIDAIENFNSMNPKTQI